MPINSNRQTPDLEVRNLEFGGWSPELRMDGVLVVDKPSGPTSHDVVARVRRALGTSRVGHTGTLDPLATGVLPLVIGRATRLASLLSARRQGIRGRRPARAARPTTYDAAERLAAGPAPPPAPRT